MIPVQVSARHKLVCVPVAPALENLFKEVTRLPINGVEHMLIPHQPAECFMLRRFGYDVPSPILTNYPWPHPLDEPPFDAQMKTSAMLTMNQRAYVLNGMGTGKTRASLWAWDYLRTHGLCGKLLVVAPLSTLKFTWMREVFNTLPNRKCSVLHGTKPKRLEALKDQDAEIFIINHDGIRTVAAALEERPDIDVMVLDELAVYRNGGSQRTKKMRKMSQRMKWVWGMTGAPIPTAPTDAWAQATIVTPTTVPAYFNQFRNDLMLKVSQFRFVPKDDATERAFAALQPAVRFSLDDIIELPEAVFRTMDIELGPQQAKVYKELAAHCFAAVQKEEITAANAGAVMNKLMQVSCGWVYAGDKIVPLDGDKRLEALIDSVLSASGKTLIFVPFKHALAGISAALTSEGIEHATVSGDTSANERSEIFTLFQTTQKFQVIAAHPQCLAHGLTLTAADTVIWYSPVTSLEIYDQANAWIRRVGQKNNQLYLHFQGTPVEKRIYAMLEKKQDVQGKLLDLFEAATLNLTI